MTDREACALRTVILILLLPAVLLIGTLVGEGIGLYGSSIAIQRSVRPAPALLKQDRLPARTFRYRTMVASSS
jgi:hypothetical protein